MSLLKNVYYINLSHRTDRKQHCEKELNEMNFEYTRFNAIKNSLGILGCGMSHLGVLQEAKKLNLDYVVIIEDDILFTDKIEYIKMLKNFFSKKIDYDVFLLGCNIKEYEVYKDNIVKVNRCFAAHGYIVKNHYYDKMIKNFKESIKNLLEKNDNQYYIDVYWQKLQKEDTFLTLLPLTVTQKEFYSDIENKLVNYEDLLLNEK